MYNGFLSQLLGDIYDPSRIDVSTYSRGGAVIAEFALSDQYRRYIDSQQEYG